jgi:hypothetical protein
MESTEMLESLARKLEDVAHTLETDQVKVAADNTLSSGKVLDFLKFFGTGGASNE